MRVEPNGQIAWENIRFPVLREFTKLPLDRAVQFLPPSAWVGERQTKTATFYKIYILAVLLKPESADR